MRTVPEYFEYFYVGEARLGAPKVTEPTTGIGRVLTIPVMNLPLCSDHPLVEAGDKAVRRYPGLGFVVDGLLVFRGVFLSRREMYEYIGDPMNPDGFKDMYVTHDVDFAFGGEVLKLYPFEGSLEEPYAFVNWDVIARSFELQVE